MAKGQNNRREDIPFGLESTLEAILENSPDIIIFLDLKSVILSVNRGAEGILGYGKGELEGKNLSYLFHDRATVDRLLRSFEAGKDATNRKVRFMNKAGEIMDISLSLFPLKDGKGKTTGAIVLGKDISEWKRTQRRLKDYSRRLTRLVEKRTIELRESKSRLEAMLSGIADGVIFADYKNRVTFINRAAELIFGIKKEDWLGKPFRKAHSEKSHKKAMKLIRDMRAGKIRSFSSEIKVGDKSVVADFSPIMHGKDYLGVIFIAKDVTAMKKLQAELLQTEKLALVGKMFSTIAHEVRNPLVPIGGFARLIDKNLDETSPLKKYASIIIKEIDRLERLLTNILSYSKEITPVFQSGNVNDILQDVLTLYKDIFSQKNIDISARLSRSISKTDFDPSLMKQALIDILINAMHAMPGGGNLTITTKESTIDGKPYISISITDTGGGIPKDIIDNIFEPFYTTKVHGMGLGLALTRRIVHVHDGSIEVESMTGKGTTFTINLPIRTGGETAERPLKKYTKRTERATFKDSKTPSNRSVH